MLKPFLGLLLSILWQILRRLPGLVSVTVPDRDDGSLPSADEPTWSRHDLESTFGTLAEQIKVKTRACLFPLTFSMNAEIAQDTAPSSPFFEK